MGLFQANLTELIETDLIYFSVFLLVANILIFICFTTFFENRLQQRVVKPIQQLTQQIKNPKMFAASNFDDGFQDHQSAINMV